MKNRLPFLLLSLVVFSLQAQTFYVAPNGKDVNKGTKESPFATLSKAKEVIRQLKKDNALDKKSTTVFLRGGVYNLSENIVFNKEDGGDLTHSIVYKAFENEVPVFNSGIRIPSNKWKPLNNTALKRVHPKVAASALVELDISQLGLTNASSFAPTNMFTTDWFIIDLIANHKRQPIAQWPNLNENIRGKNDYGYTTCNGSKDNHSFYFGSNGKPQDKDTTNELDLDGSFRSMRWMNGLKDGHEFWLKGLWRTPWEPITIKAKAIDLSDNSIELTKAPPSGMGSKYSTTAGTNPVWRQGNGKESWFVLNVLEEIDQPGEWALDIKDKKIYYYPPAPLESLEILIADNKTPMFQFNNTNNIELVGFSLEGGLGNGIELKNSNHIHIAECNISNVGNTGIAVVGGSYNSIQSNDIYETGGWGIELKNVGDRASLISSNDTINNNHIHHVGKLAFKEAIILTNVVGVIISHNLLHDIPKGALRTDDCNNCLFEYNEVHNIALKEGDTGSFYNYGGWSTYGNVFRYNFMHHTNKANGFYSDDGDSGDFYYFNIVQGCQSGILFGGGHDLVAEHNLFIQSKKQSIDDRGKDRDYRLGTKYETNLTKFDVFNNTWKKYGDSLVATFHLTTHLWSDVLNLDWHPEFPNGGRMVHNVAVASGKFNKPKNGNVIVDSNYSIEKIGEAGFFDYANMDVRTNNTQILEQFPTLNDVFPLIGLVKDSYRKRIPSRKETGGLSDRTGAENVDTEDKMIDKKPPTQKK